ncbi:MAG: hypothetical protein V4459_08570 [Pseudomonadota bacterium]
MRSKRWKECVRVLQSTLIDLAASQDDSQIQAAEMPGEIVHAYLA